MRLYDRIASEGLAPTQQVEIFRREMTDYRNGLLHLVPSWEALPPTEQMCDPVSNLHIFEAWWAHVAENGIAEPISVSVHSPGYFPSLEPLARHALGVLLASTPGLAASFQREVDQRLGSLGIAGSALNRPLAAKLVAAARSLAARGCLEGSADFFAPPAPSSLAEAPITVAQTPVTAASSASVTGAEYIPDEWRHRSAQDIAKLLIEKNPRMFAHRADGKRAAAQTGEQSERQILWAAVLLDRTLGGRPYWTRTEADFVELDRHFDHLPVNFGKSPRHRDPSFTLERAELEAIELLEKGEIDAGEIGFTSGTTNKHFRCLARIDRLARKAMPQLPVVDFAEYCTPDIKHERDARQRISNEQAVHLFSLPPWTGCVGEHDRLTAGSIVIHDGLFWVPILVWYTGARREEICKLLILDIDQLNGIWFIRIATTVTGRVKNKSAVRIIAVCDELVRLGFIEFVLAMKAAGEKLLFPEFMPGTPATKRKLGDVFYKIWWIYLGPLVQPRLMRGQAMHSCRHSVSDELKAAEIFLETRNDLLGHAGKGGEGETRYPAPTRLAKLKAAVDLIPLVTGHLQTITASNLRLLSPALRIPRPSKNDR